MFTEFICDVLQFRTLYFQRPSPANFQEKQPTAIMTDQQFNQHVRETQTVFTSVALKFTSDRQDAQDLIQETLMRVYRSRDSFQEGTNFKNWGLMIMRNTFINEYRKRKVRWLRTHKYRKGFARQKPERSSAMKYYLCG